MLKDYQLYQYVRGGKDPSRNAYQRTFLYLYHTKSGKGVVIHADKSWGKEFIGDINGWDCPVRDDFILVDNEVKILIPTDCELEMYRFEDSLVIKRLNWKDHYTIIGQRLGHSNGNQYARGRYMTPIKELIITRSK